jgi:hypothetical protein
MSQTDFQFASSKLTATMRGLLSGCKVDRGNLVYSVEPRRQKAAEEEYISKYKKTSKSKSRKRRKV